MNIFQKTYDFSWIRCNKCFVSISHLNKVVLTSCGHFLCYNCSRGIPGFQTNCPICNVSTTTITINSERDIPEDLLHYFEPPATIIKKITESSQQLVEITTWRYTQLEEYAKHLESDLAAERDKIRKMEATVGEQQTLRKQVNLMNNENSKLRLNLSGNVSALQFSSKPASSLINEFMHNKSPASEDKPKSIISKESMQQLFSQRPNTSSILQATPLFQGTKRPPPTPVIEDVRKRRRIDESSFSVPSTPPKPAVSAPNPPRSADAFSKYLQNRTSANKENEVNFAAPPRTGNETPTNKSTAERFAELRSQNEEAAKIRHTRDANTADRFAKLRNVVATKNNPGTSGAQPSNE